MRKDTSLSLNNSAERVDKRYEGSMRQEIGPKILE